MFRTLLLKLSEQQWLRNWTQNSKAAARFTSRFVAGPTLDDALQVCVNLQKEGILSTLDHLGENVTSLKEAKESRNASIRALKGIADSTPEATISIKLTQLGLDFSEQHCRQYVGELAQLAKQLGTRVEIDMESSEYTDRTLAIVRQQHKDTGNVRAVIQAYLKRSESDIKQLSDERIPVRLCKGAYREPATVAFQDKSEVDRSYSRLMRRLLEKGTDPAIASHDEKLIREALDLVRSGTRKAADFEFQMLYGIRRDLQRKLIAGGFRLRLYVPYGDAWYPYFMRRLAERPANVWFVLRNWMRG